MPIIKIPARVPRSGKSVKGSTKRPKKGPKMAPPKKTPPPPQRRRDSSSSLSSPANLSDDDGYSALEDASDSEDDDEDHVFAAEEEHILSHQRHHKKSAARSSPRSSSDFEDDEAADADDDDSGDEDVDVTENSKPYGFGDENAVDDNSSESESWNGFSVEEEQPPYPDSTLDRQSGTPVERHVRFAGVPDSGSDSDETDDVQGEFDELFPDIFIAQDALDSTFRREIEQDDEMDSDVSFTYWDHNGGAEFEGFSDAETPQQKQPGTTHYGWDPEDSPTRMLPGMTSANLAASAGSPNVPEVSMAEEEEEDESDGYETDGETTEEDEPIPPPSITQTPQRKLSTKASEEPRVDATGDDNRPAIRPSTSRRKPICVLNPHTRKMMIFTPRMKRTSQMIPFQIPLDYFSQTMTTQSSPIRNGPVFARGGSWQADDSLASINVPANFMELNDPFWSHALKLGPGSDSSSFPDEEDEEDALEKDLNIHDFVTFDGGDFDDDVEPNDDAAEDGNTDGAETPSRRPSAASLNSDSNHTNSTFSTLLNHFTQRPNSVGAFRLNQTNQKLILNGEATQDSLAFSNPYFHGTLRGIKHGSLNGAATPLTPERRHKRTMAKSPAETAASKRKASGMNSDHSHAHKKQRSITDVSRMQI